MNYAGSDLKFKVTTSYEDFSLADNDFEIVIKNRWGQVVATIKKDDCFSDDDGNFYFTVENVKNGVYFADFRGAIDDEDYVKQVAIVSDEQKIYEVGRCECGCAGTNTGCKCEHKVHYEQVWTANVDGGIYLVGKDGAYILTSDNKRIKFPE